MRTRPILLLAVSCLCTSVSAVRADPDATARTEARELAQQGDGAFTEGRCDRAISLWSQAAAKFEAPTILVRIAQCQGLLGRVVEATATLERVVAMKFPPDAPAVFTEARVRAIADLPRFRARIARLKLTIDRRGLQIDPVLEIDHAKMDRVDGVFLLDPGDHFVHLTVGDGNLDKSVRLGDGEQREVKIRLARNEPPATSSLTQARVGYMLGAAGLVTIGIGAMFGLRALELRSDIRNKCPNKTDCGDWALVDNLKTNSVAADIAFGAGAVLFGGGLVLYLTDKGAPTPEKPRLHVTPMGAGAAVGGSF